MSDSSDTSITTNNTLVHFCFESGYDNPSIELALSREALLSVPQSLLAKLANERWNSDQPSMGLSASEPITVLPLQKTMSSSHKWTPALVEMVQDYYNDYYEENSPWLTLSPDVDLEDALSVFDYCGLELSDPLTDSLDFCLLDTATRLGYKLHLKNSDLLNRAERMILDCLDKRPREVTPFVFMTKHHGTLDTSPRNGSVLFAMLHDCELFEFVRTKSNREELVDLLQDQHDLACAWQSDETRYHKPRRDKPDRDHPIESRQPEGYCWLAFQEDRDRGYGRYDYERGYGYGRRPFHEEALPVLEVAIETRVNKRRRLG